MYKQTYIHYIDVVPSAEILKSYKNPRRRLIGDRQQKLGHKKREISNVQFVYKFTSKILIKNELLK